MNKKGKLIIFAVVLGFLIAAAAIAFDVSLESPAASRWNVVLRSVCIGAVIATALSVVSIARNRKLSEN